MSNELSKSSRFIMGALSVSFLLASATAPLLIANSKEHLEHQKALPDEKIQAHYADTCIQRDAKKSFESTVKALGANGPYAVLVTVDPNSESVKSCPKQMHEVRIHAAKAAYHFDIFAGVGSLALGALAGYTALGNRKNNEPKPS